MESPRRDIDKGKRHGIITLVLCLFSVCVWGKVNDGSKDGNEKPKSPIEVEKTSLKEAAKDTQKVVLDYADELVFDQNMNPDFQILKGNVRFHRAGMKMFCDSAYFYETSNSMDAFGNVRMEQGDTLFVFSDVMYYDGVNEIAQLRYNVRLQNRDVTLYTDSLNYDLIPNIGYYYAGGKIIDSQNELTSIYGEYSPDTKDAIFYFDVVLKGNNATLYSDTLQYNTATHIADICSPTVIQSDSGAIYSRDGWYDTNNNQSTLYKRSIVVNKTYFLTGDTIFYDRDNGYGEVFGGMFLEDTLRKVIMQGEYGYYFERNDSAMATDSAVMIDCSQIDTLYLHADTLRTITLADSTRLMKAYFNTRFYRRDIQGVCDSMVFDSRDTAIYMFRNPVLWNTAYQLFGDTIRIYMNDSTIDWMHIPSFAFAVQQKDTAFFDQISGKDMKGYFFDGNMDKVDVSGNVRTIFYPQEEDSTFTGLNNAISGFLSMTINHETGKMDKLTMWPEVEGSLTPIPMIKPKDLYLPDFRWYQSIRPKNPEDIFRRIKNDSEELPKKRRKFSNTVEDMPVP